MVDAGEAEGGDGDPAESSPWAGPGRDFFSPVAVEESSRWAMPQVTRHRAIKAKVVACPSGVSDREGCWLGFSGGEEVASLGPQGTDGGDDRVR